MRTNRLLRSLTLLLGTGIAAVSTPSSADSYYFGASAGQSFVDETGIKDEDTAFKVFGGYRLNEYVGVEVGYVDHGKMIDGANQFEVNGGALAAVGTLPVNDKFSLHAKAGAYFWDLTTQGTIAAGFTDNSNTDAFYGAGASYRFGPNWSVVGEWERYEVENFKIDFLSVGVLLQY